MKDFALKIGDRHAEVVDVFDSYPAQVSVPAAGQATVVSHFIRGGIRPILKKVANLVLDSTGGPYISFTVFVNGAPVDNLINITSQLTDPANGSQLLPYEREISQSCLIELIAYNSDPVNAHPVLGRIVVYYEKI